MKKILVLFVVLLTVPFGGVFAGTANPININNEVEYKASNDVVCAKLNKTQMSCGDVTPYLTVMFDTSKSQTYDGCPITDIKAELEKIKNDASFVVIGSADRQNASGIYNNTVLAKNRADYVVKNILPSEATKKILDVSDQNAKAYAHSINNQADRGVYVFVIWHRCNPDTNGIDAAYNKIEQFYDSLGLSVWRDAEGNFNTARLASDSVAAVVLGTVGGIVTSKVVKKNQIKQGFEDLNCSVGGQRVAGYGDEFTVGMQ